MVLCRNRGAERSPKAAFGRSVGSLTEKSSFLCGLVDEDLLILSFENTLWRSGALSDTPPSRRFSPTVASSAGTSVGEMC